MNETILGPGGRVKALLREDAAYIKILTPGGTVLGQYDKSNDITTTAGGKFIGYGNQLFTLID